MRPERAARSRAVASVAIGLLCGASLVLVAHQRDVARSRAAAAENLIETATHLQHLMSDLSENVASSARRLPGPGVAFGRLPLFVSGMQLVIDGEVVEQTHRSDQPNPQPEFLTCAEHAGAKARVVPYQTLPLLRLAACVSTETPPEAPRAASNVHARPTPTPTPTAHPGKAAARSSSWLVVWLDTESLFEAAGLPDLTENGFDYRLRDITRGEESVLATSRDEAWTGVGHEIAFPEGRWLLELTPRDHQSLHAPFVAGAVMIVMLSSLVGVMVGSARREAARLRAELDIDRAQRSELENRLTDEFERRRSAEEKLEHGVWRDQLTELPNRTSFLERLDEALDSVRRRGASATALLLDVVELRRINDSMGREVGDQVLRGIARRIEESLSPEDVLARVGADQFAVIALKREEIEQTVRWVEDALDRIEQPFTLGGTDVFVSCRIGAVVPDETYDRAEDVLRDATIALNQARADDGRLQVFGQEMHARAVKLLEIETDLRRAVERDEMVAYYQPILSLTTGRIIGFETLARWQHPERGIVSPADFIPIAEQTGLIIQIDRWNLAEAARQLALWQRDYPKDVPLKMSANLAANELSQPDIVDFVASVLAETKLNPRTIAIEVTESGVMKNPESAAKILTGLKALGVHLHLDDFGTGYSSLAYLHRFSFDLLKIDRAFVGRMTSDGKSYELVKTVMALAQALGMGVVAEGIETEEQLAQLRSLGCAHGQGFLFSRPVPPAEIGPLLDEDPVW